MSSRETEQTYNRRYYRKRSVELSALRKELYETDPTYRAQARERSRRAREENPKQYSQRVYYRDVTISGEPTTIEVLPTGHVAKILDRTPQLVRSWERKGWIPPPTFSGRHRLYTSHQVARMINLSDALTHAKGRRSAPEVEAAIQRVHTEWNMLSKE